MFLPHTGRHYFNPRSPHGERRAVRKVKILKVRISIHAPRTGSDGSYFQIPHTMGISIHAPRTGSDGFTTLMLCGCVNFNPRSPHGERRFHNVNALRLCQFQSTLPARGATEMKLPNSSADWISIHAPRTGSDNSTISRKKFYPNFNPRSPHGERHNHCNFWLCRCYFNPRSPHGERRFMTNLISFTRRISIHAPRTGSDSSTAADDAAARFQSTLPARGATQAAILFRLLILISIHAPRTGSDV